MSARDLLYVYIQYACTVLSHCVAPYTELDYAVATNTLPITLGSHSNNSHRVACRALLNRIELS